MDRLTIREAAPDAGVIAGAARALVDGGLIAYPTETFYAIGADPRSDAAVDCVFAAKARPSVVAIPLIAGSLGQVLEVAGDLSPLALRLAGRFWPGPLTLVIPAWEGLSLGLKGGTSTVAVRVSGHRVARLLCEEFGYPITSTSANLSGAPAPSTAGEIEAGVASWLAMVLDGGRTSGGQPSTIVDVTGEEPRLVRAGATSWEQVLECLR